MTLLVRCDRCNTELKNTKYIRFQVNSRDEYDLCNSCYKDWCEWLKTVKWEKGIPSDD